MIAEEFKYPIEQLRLWQFSVRQNHTLRPDTLIEGEIDEKTLLDVSNYKSHRLNEVCFYFQVNDKPIGVNQYNEAYYFKGKNDVGYNGILLFIKYYDPNTATMEYVKALEVNSITDKISSYVPSLLNMKNIPPETKIQLYEEIKPEMVDILDINQTFEQAELSNGDIICFQVHYE